MIYKLGASLLCISCVSSNCFADEPGKSIFPSYTQSLLFEKSGKTRQLFTLDGLQVWSIELPGGKPEIVLTTRNGLLIRGKVLGPRGEDIFSTLTAAPSVTSSGTRAPAIEGRGEQTLNVEALSHDNAKQVQSSEGPPARATFDARVASGIDDPSVPVFKTLAELREQADTYSMWIEANQSRAGAPVLYMFADPRCPFCAKSMLTLKPYLDSGAIELRIIPTPVLSPLSFSVAVTFVHDKNPGAAFISHSAEMLNGEPEKAPLPPDQMDQSVVKAMTKNVKWFRKNQLRSVPFYLYKSSQGDQIFYGQIDDDKIRAIIQDGKPDARSNHEQK